ncbi:oxidoreductase domain protein [Chloroherpeton thalassium ATCC 35110]|uniref:Oxidoreductase domain protein n=2 Tax=Chloroherpeton thalassium TaxID=100716 RepID=B3QU38_CHLT3|nr:Gfo/Idh/MocA family oxidoreductase [Chloroherpeton thalassium]ACF12836.1 oxidoreductase domain protein [Chloroherpeton thalassium ATCC 35110]
MKIAVIGLGYWGPNLVRNFLAVEQVDGVIGCDKDESRLHKLKKRFPEVELCSSLDEVLTRDDVAAVAIATPVSTHYPLAKKALEAGKHCFVEKPFTTTVAEAEDLINTAEKKGLKIMVDHTFIYTGAVRKIKEVVDKQMLGDLYYFDSVRVNLGLFQHDVNVVWDLAPHDLSIMDYVLGKKPTSVSAIGSDHTGSGLENMAYLTVGFNNGLMAHFHVNWLAPVKIRKTLIGGSKSMIVYDDMEASEKIKIYDKGIEVKTREGVYETLVQYRTGDMLAPKLDQTEALAIETNHFVDCMLNNKTPLTDGISGLNVVRILEASEKSIKNSGSIVKLS